jgi:hypothetical protein
LALEPSSDTVINTLGLSPAGVDTFVGVALMSVEALRAYIIDVLTPYTQINRELSPMLIRIALLQKIRENISMSTARWDGISTYAS